MKCRDVNLTEGMSWKRTLAAFLLAAATAAHAAIPAMPEIPTILPDDIRQPLIAIRQPLAQRKLALVEEGDAINKQCAHVLKDSPEYKACLDEVSRFNAAVEVLRGDMDRLADKVDDAVARYTIASMNMLARKLEWSTDELARLDAALKGLAADGDPDISDVQIRQTWKDILARSADADLAREAGHGEGPVFPGAGTQTQHEDCAVFALANAVGLPYGVVAARAAKLIAEGEWRDAATRANPQIAIEQHGLTGGEVVMLAEAFGQVEVVHGTDFASVLASGRTVMVDVVPADGDVNSGHEVVLTRAFTHAGETWYEMMDSNQGPIRRLYLSSRELRAIQQENGVAYRRDPGTTPMLLR